MRKFTPQEDAFIIANMLLLPQKTMAKMLGRADSVVRQRLNRLGYFVPKEVAQHFARESFIKPGNVPVNKGVKMSKMVYKKCAPTMFKKGQLPKNTKHNGAITTRIDNRGVKGLWIRISQSKWEPLSRNKWKKYRGDIPDGMIIIHKDGNALNCKISNLKMISKRENAIRNSIHNLPKEIVKQKLLIGAFNRKINNYVKNNQ